MSFFYRRREGEYSLNAFSATPPVSESSAAIYPRVRPSGITRGYAWCASAGGDVGVIYCWG
ncbi:hypothetical protein [Alloprevotella rava]|uniref:Uncharacterized protein n=1 Tax=Alloprevotella rava TaxID=671218 RepID=A0A7W5YE30_9BACT|nr:hypothetical protein [Alloprevotella rava]MBB3702894.1 hypothetical protein [Alloprevotella rava]